MGSRRDRDVSLDTKQPEPLQPASYLLAPRKQKTGSHKEGAMWSPLSGTGRVETSLYLGFELSLGSSRQGLWPTVT